jgi:hypothetical protein
VTVLLSHQGIALGTLLSFNVALGLNFLWLLHLWLLQPLPQTPSSSEFEVFQGKIATNKLVGIQSIDITTNTRFIEQIFKMNDYNSSYHFIDLNPNTWVQDFNLKWGGYSVDGDGYVCGGVIVANSELSEPLSQCHLSTLNRYLDQIRLILGRHAAMFCPQSPHQRIFCFDDRTWSCSEMIVQVVFPSGVKPGDVPAMKMIHLLSRFWICTHFPFTFNPATIYQK